jgi:autotransporter strand-loop-strand O-heptosyltransferase
MKIINITPGLIPIPPNGWGAVEKIIWDYHQQLVKLGIRSEIKYVNEVQYDDSCIVHVHVANLANQLRENNIPYIFSIHDHHAYLYGKESGVFKENLKAIENSVFSLSPCKYLIPYFGSKKLRYFSHAVNTNIFKFNNRQRHKDLKLLCVANNGYAYDQSKDRKGFKLAIQAAKSLGLPLTIAGPRNNENFFKTLEPELLNYTRLTKLYDLDEKWLIDLYNEHDAFLHFSELEAGHPNLTLLEAMACGLPVIGTFEESLYKGMEVCNRDLDSAISSINKVDSQYDLYRQNALKNAESNSYEKRIHDLILLYSEYREKIFGNRIINGYKNTKISPRTVEVKNKINISFIDGAKAEVLGKLDKKYKAKFYDLDKNQLVYESELKNNMWCSPNKKSYVRWRVEVYEIENDSKQTLIEKQDLEPKGKKVKVILDTESLGDLLAFIQPIEEFRKKHECEMYCVVFEKHLRKIFEENYKNIKFLSIDKDNHEYYSVYRVGYFTNWENHLSDNPKKMTLSHICSDVLGFGKTEFKPNLTFNKTNRHNKKYVCISTQSTAQAKYWNYPDGWDKIVDYLNSRGYEAWCIDRHSSFGTSKKMNHMPQKAINKTGHFPLEERMSQIYNSEFFIGLSSGLSWLAWSVGKPVVMISGFTEAFNEFYTPHRIINTNVCNGCWNDTNYEFDKGNWFWCPRNKDFECTKTITPEMVIEQIDKIIIP